ncbi:MAG: hypothetical protein AAGC60_18410 [Acidobacteriota bacterium]
MNRAPNAILVGCFIAACGAVGLIVLGLYFFVQEHPLLEASLQAPNEAIVGEEFTLSIELSNPHDEAVQLDSIDVDESLLAGFQVLEIEPTPTDSLTLPFIEQRSWSFGRTLKPGQKAMVSFRLKPLSAGHFTGSLDVCNPAQDWVGLYADIVVRAP